MPPKLDLEKDTAKDTSLPALAQSIAAKGPHKTLATQRRVRIILGGHYVADTTAALFVWEHPYYPQYYLPASAFTPSALRSGQSITSPASNTPIAHLCTLTSGARSTSQVLSFSDSLSGPGSAVAGHVKVVFNEVDQWLEEDTPIYVHPKDPFKRIDILHSTRPITVSVQGKQVAKTESSMHLFETGLPTRYYMPLTAVDVGVLRRSETRTQCPYKGEAEYYDVVLGEGEEMRDVVWYYTRPTVECATIQGLVCFYNEKVEIELDGKKEVVPKTPWS